MTDCPPRTSTDPPHRLPTAIVAVILSAACIVSSGCITGPDGRLLGTHSLGMLVDGDNGCDCCQHHHGAGCQACDESAWPADGSADSHEEWYASEAGDGLAPLPLDACAGGTCGSTCDDGSSGRPRRRWYEPEAGIFNFCVPPGVIGAPPPPPPGRFHPVPTRPVFTPRPSLALSVPYGA
jgi:hypothetical protein